MILLFSLVLRYKKLKNHCYRLTTIKRNIMILFRFLSIQLSVKELQNKNVFFIVYSRIKYLKRSKRNLELFSLEQPISSAIHAFKKILWNVQNFYNFRLHVINWIVSNQSVVWSFTDGSYETRISLVYCEISTYLENTLTTYAHIFSFFNRESYFMCNYLALNKYLLKKDIVIFIEI